MSLSSVVYRRGITSLASRCRSATASLVCDVSISRQDGSAQPMVPNVRFLSNNNTTTTSISMMTRDDGGPIVLAQQQQEKEKEWLDFSSMSNDELSDPSTIPGWDLVHCPPRSMPRGALVGTVVSDKMDKTVNVAVDRYRIVEKYRKRLKYTRKFMAHDEAELCKIGDTVMIVPCQRISKRKHFMVREIITAKGQL